MTCTCQAIATHTAVIFFFISSLSVRSQTYDNVSRTDICIVNYISTFHAACHCTVDNNSTNQVTNIGSFTSCCINTYSHFSQFGKQISSVPLMIAEITSPGTSSLLRPIVDDTKILSTAPTHNKSSIFIIKASCANSFPNRQVTSFFPV